MIAWNTMYKNTLQVCKSAKTRIWYEYKNCVARNWVKFLVKFFSTDSKKSNLRHGLDEERLNLSSAIVGCKEGIFST